MKFKMPREFYIPKKSIKVSDKLSDTVAYLWVSAGSGKPGATIFVGKQAKPVSNYSYRDEARRAAAIGLAFESRRKSLAFRAEQQSKRRAWVPDYKVGEILHTCWGYDQTNVEYFEIIEVRGKHVILRELAQARKKSGWCQGTCVPLPGSYVGEPLRRLAQEHGIKISSCRTAFRSNPEKIAGIEVHKPIGWSSYA